jgi:glycosyltransferase involved in cell wall biosynthesis
MPSVSILIPCFNAERWVAGAIQSALEQTHENKEVIVVNDGSTDRSLKIIKSFGNRIRWESGPNRGGNHARNRLLELSTGEWLQYLDADDYLRPQKIENQLAAIASASTPVDAVYSPVTVEEWTTSPISRIYKTQISDTQSVEEQWIRWKVAQTGALLWNRSRLLALGGWNIDFQCCQDNELTMRAILSGLKFLYYGGADAVYRIWSESTVSRRSPTRVIKVRTELIRKFRETLRQTQRWNTDLEKAVGEVVFEHARTLARHRIDDGCQYLREDALSEPSIENAPRIYRVLYRLCGFRVAELAALLTRGLR